MTPATAVKRARARWRLERQDRPNGETCWMVLDRTNSGHGIYGDEAAGRAEYEKHIMLRALEMIDPEHDWHEYDWHTLTGPIEERVARMLAWRAECEKARAEVLAVDVLVRALVRSR
jgi:hypothetical protein